MVGDRAQVGGLVVTDGGVATEHLVVWSGLGFECSAEGGGVHGHDPAIGERGDGGVVRLHENLAVEQYEHGEPLGG